MSRSYFDDYVTPLGDQQEDSYTTDEMYAKTRALYMRRVEMYQGEHWTLKGKENCIRCGEYCERTETVIGGESWPDECGVRAREWARGTLGYAKTRPITT